MLFDVLIKLLGIGDMLLTCWALKDVIGFDVILQGCSGVQGFATAPEPSVGMDIHVGF